MLRPSLRDNYSDGLLGGENRRARAHAAVVGDHAVAGDEAEPGVGDARAEGLSRELPDRFDQSEEAARGAGLAAGELAARGVERTGAVGREGVLTHELRGFALAAQAETFELNHVHDRVVV